MALEPRGRGVVGPPRRRRGPRPDVGHDSCAEPLPVGARADGSMSKFFKALEQAEQERALRHGTRAPALVEVGRAVETKAVEQQGARPPRAVFQEAPDGVEEHLVSLLAPTSSEAEQYRALRHLIEQLHRSADLSVVAVTSPGGEDGKTTTAINLAGALGRSPEGRVLL